MSCDVGEVTERLENEQSSFIDLIFMIMDLMNLSNRQTDNVS